MAGSAVVAGTKAMNEQRPDPDRLLERVQKEETQRQRGRLKIFFGACAGVGKTFAMLSAAHGLKAQGIDVVIGLVETHGRVDTAELLKGLETLPPKSIDYRGRNLTEFDLDGVLARKPALVVVDELAHTNVPGSRHAKRWQDVEELLDAGIGVYTTVNVQHLETLNDVVGRITGIRVLETIPDTVFDRADEVTVVDLPPDELLQRLKDGKVYVPQQVEHAAQNFFRKGNLIALRELSLRRTADRVDAQMREYREDKSIRSVWQAKERLLVCVGPGPDGQKLVRGAARLAANLRADWIAIYVETPRLQRLPSADRDRILRTLQLARDLGAETTTMGGSNVPATLLSYARSRNVSKLVVGRTSRPAWRRRFATSIAEQLSLMVPDVDIYVVAYESDGKGQAVAESAAAAREFDGSGRRRSNKRGYIVAVVACVVTTAVSMLLAHRLSLTNIVMLYLLSVMLVAFRYSRGPAVLSSVLAVLAFDFFLVPPQLSFSVSDAQYVITFLVMLAMALVISNLAYNLRYQARVATLRERRARSLYEAARELSGAVQTEQIVEIANRNIRGVFQAETAVLLPDLSEHIIYTPPPDGTVKTPQIDTAIAQWVFDHQQPAGYGTNTLAGSPFYYLPLKAPIRPRGVLALAPRNPRMVFVPEQHRLLETFASQIALALERVHFVHVAQEALMKIESERLRNSMLSAVSHDLRTPLTALVGLASTLASSVDLPKHTRRELAQAAADEAMRMSNLVTNMLDMARLQSEGVYLNRQWHVLEEIVGGALNKQLADHDVRVSLDASLPLIYVDGVLIERVLYNLVENAVKYTPPASSIRITGQIRDGDLAVSVEDDGPGLPPGMIESVFEKFTRGERESSTVGMGLGLAICRAIVQAHHGQIWAENMHAGGARFTFTLPLLEPPQVPEQIDTDPDQPPGKE